MGGRGVQNSQKCDDVIYEWSLMCDATEISFDSLAI